MIIGTPKELRTKHIKLLLYKSDSGPSITTSQMMRIAGCYFTPVNDDMTTQHIQSANYAKIPNCFYIIKNI